MTEIPVIIILPRKTGKSVLYRLTSDLTIAGQWVPAGFESDGATVPRWFWPIYPPVDTYMPAAILHDWLLVNDAGWRVANSAFKQAMKELGVPGWRSKPMIAAARLYGWWRTTFFNDAP